MRLVAEEEKWVRASARRKHLLGRRLDRRPDKCDAGPTLKVGFWGYHNSRRSDTRAFIADRVEDIFSGIFFEDSGAISEPTRNLFSFSAKYGILFIGKEVGQLRVYLDMCCYNRPYDDQSQIKVSLETQAKLHIQDLIQKKRLELVTSYMLRYECGQNPYEMRRRAIMQFVDMHTMAYVGLERKDEIESMAVEIMNTGVKFKDACHVASAIYAKCECFISTDMRLLKYKTDRIKMVTPIEFVTETEDE